MFWCCRRQVAAVHLTSAEAAALSETGQRLRRTAAGVCGRVTHTTVGTHRHCTDSTLFSFKTHELEHERSH